MWQDLKYLSPQVAALYMAKESDQALRSQPRPEDVIDREAVERTKARIKKRWAEAQTYKRLPFRKKSA